MKKVKTITLEELSGKTSEEIIFDLRHERYSILESIGCHDLRQEMVKTGKACRFILKTAERRARRKRGNYNRNLQISMANILNWGAPTTIFGTFPHFRGGIVFGFNHPSLGEIIRIIAICLNEYPEHKYLFPVNLAWYEELAPVARRLERMHIYIVPIISPSTRDKIARRIDNEETMRLIDKIEKNFVFSYLENCKKFVISEDIIVVAQSATRQATVYRSPSERFSLSSIEPKTMTLIAMSLLRLKNWSFYFVPLAVVPPIKADNKLNLFKAYKMSVCDWITSKTADELCHTRDSITKDRKFEHYFLERIANEMHKLDESRLVSP